MAQQSEQPRKFFSASSFLINLFGGLCYIAAVVITLRFYPETDAFNLALIGIVAAVVPIVLCEIIFLKVHRRARVGLLSSRNPDRERLSIKLLGYYASLALVFCLYLIVPEYDNATYDNGFLILLFVLFIYIIGGWVYFSEFDPRMKDPCDDACWHFGNCILGRWDLADREKVKAHIKSVLLRAFYLPLMLTYMVYFTDLFLNSHDQFMQSMLPDMEHIPGIILLKTLVMAYFVMALMDVIFGSIGYLVVLKAIDSDIQSTEPTFLGWFVCLICYAPFWEVVFIKSIFFDLYNNPAWHAWFREMPMIILIWGSLTVIFQGLEAMATQTFGVRFSNLTYRGLMATGPFRYTKHPQYIFKMLNRFFFLVPFLSLYGVWGVICNMLGFLGVCFIYFLRARTEENHLSRYPEYVEYADWMNTRGMFRFMNKILPFVEYSEARAKAGKIF